jgi:hypothetical protein
MTESRYKGLLYLYIVLCGAMILAMLFPSYSSELSAAYDAEPESVLMSNWWVAVGLLVAILIPNMMGLLGLFYFKRWARSLSLWSTVAAFVLYPFLGPSLMSGLESAFVEAASAVWGAVLALSYYSPVSAKFER